MGVGARTKVRELGHAVRAHHDVVGLDVAMDERLLEVVVKVGESLGRAEREAVAEARWESLGTARSRSQA